MSMASTEMARISLPSRLEWRPLAAEEDHEQER
jgi:hypothetical protein